jgi:S1-C subfamily serine protease
MASATGRGWISLLLMFTLFNFSCSTPAQSCQGLNFVSAPTDGRSIPHNSFAFIELETYYQPCAKSDGSTVCDVETRLGSGVFIHLSRAKGSAYVMTAKHTCDRRHDLSSNKEPPLWHTFTVYDYYGRAHKGEFVFASAHADICVVLVRDVDHTVVAAPLSNSPPDVGELVYNMAAPGGYFMPRAVLIFSGLYSGVTPQGLLFTITTKQGSSGSPIFNSRGELISMTTGVPVRTVERDGKETELTIAESVALAEYHNDLADTIASIETMDELFGVDLITPTVTSSAPLER